MFIGKVPANKADGFAYEDTPFITPSGFREYDARWLFPQQINLAGFRHIGLALGTLIHEYGQKPDIVVGHDFRSYSASVKHALIIGLIAAGCRVRDIGLCLSPTAYFAQFALDAPCVAMVTASHNENGWTGIKMGINRPLTLGNEEMTRLRDISLNDLGVKRSGGSYELIADFDRCYLDDLVGGRKIKRPLKAVVACGNGTAGAFAPFVCRELGCEVIELDCGGDYSFPNYNPNPEDMKMLAVLSDKVVTEKADLGLAFDGDGDRCGVIDDTGTAIFADKVGVMLARNLVRENSAAVFIADVKSTGLFASDPVLREFGATTIYGKTGHSYMKKAVNDHNAIAGFEKSGHFFFNKPIGRGYDDGLLTARCVLEMLDNNPQQSLSDLRLRLPHTWGSPTMSVHCPDDVKYAIVDEISRELQAISESGVDFTDQPIVRTVTVNGIRIETTDGTWGLVRASSNKPELVVVVESPVSEAGMKNMFIALDRVIRQHDKVGEYNQTI